ncbi:hypothetical protein DES39_0516 [Orbus hercynius]|uniref:Translocation protein TolB n=1 Tax=Orbus hercynius TaxID=593135 RepID=A0A495RJF5_9GAMM|nr:hypothetical protein [Orbus hercynius]RKS87296.1 hypothetical protein DES39_0516 [Orbus hercynius]
MLVRCSSLHKIMSGPREKDGTNKLSDTAKSYVREVAKLDLFSYENFDGNKYTEKGNFLEDIAIQSSGLIRARKYQKHDGRINNDWITGECDILDKKISLIIDIKNSWDIGTHPFFKDEAEIKAKKAGYDIQVQGYMWLYDVEKADIDFWLFPASEEMLSPYEDRTKLIDLVEAIPLRKRVTTISFIRDESLIEKIKVKSELAQEYYEQLIKELN